MNILLTGAFGNVGTSTLKELRQREHTVRCFDLDTRTNRKIAHNYQHWAEIVWGDIRRAEDVRAAVAGQDVVIHLAAIIPPRSDADPELARAVNVGGIQNIIAALQAMPAPARLIHISTYALYGRTQHLAPPRTVDDPIQTTDPYTEQKAEAEALVQASGLQWAILRLAAALPMNILGNVDPLAFELPLSDRIEFIHTHDAGLAMANAAEADEIFGKILLIGGGPNCQLYQRELLSRSLEAMGLDMLPEEAFTAVPYHTDWLDTAESQRLLHYQRYTYDDYIEQVAATLGYRRLLIRLFRPLIRRWILSQSPYYRAAINKQVSA